MSNHYFQFKQFTIHQDCTAMKVTTDGCLFGAWCASEVQNLKGNVLDIGTGTGLLSLMVAQKNDLSITAVEIDEAAAEQAKENTAASPWKERIQVIQEDLLRFEAGIKFDIIVSNPPFYENELSSPENKRATAHHSGGLTLSQLLQKSKELLTEDGDLFLMLPAKRSLEIKNLLAQYGFYVHHEVSIRDTEEKPPIRLMLHCRNSEEKKIEETMVIKKGNSYTDEFIALLQDYYLYL